MHKGLTLIELIFSMMIIAVVFTIIPKIVFVSNKSLELSKKEDALFNAYSLMGSINRLSWDDNTINSGGKILDTSDNSCDDRRIGGFLGSRNCIESDLSASSIGIEGSDFNDIDDYDGSTTDVNATINGSNKNIYDINTTVAYVENDYTSSANTKELKEVKTTVYSGADNNKMTGFKASFVYFSANLGHIQIKKRAWDQ